MIHVQNYQYVLNLNQVHVHHMKSMNQKFYNVKKMLLKLNLFNVYQDIKNNIIQREKKKLLNNIQRMYSIEIFLFIKMEIIEQNQMKDKDNNTSKKLLLMMEFRIIVERNLILKKIDIHHIEKLLLKVIDMYHHHYHQKIIWLLMVHIVNMR